MNLLRAGLIEKINRFPKLCAADNGIINKQQLLTLYQVGVYFTKGRTNGLPLRLAKPMACGTPESGTPAT